MIIIKKEHYANKDKCESKLAQIDPFSLGGEGVCVARRSVVKVVASLWGGVLACPCSQYRGFQQPAKGRNEGKCCVGSCRETQRKGERKGEARGRRKGAGEDDGAETRDE